MSGSTSTLEPPVAPMDPRIKARRIEVRRFAGRRRLQRLVDLGLLLAVAAGFAGALRSPLLDVDAVEITGGSRTGTPAVRAQLGIEEGEALMDVDLAAAGARLADLPWIAEARLTRGVDGTVGVVLTERGPAAVVGEGSRAMLVDGEGRVLAPVEGTAEVPASLVRIAGVDVPAVGAYLEPGLRDVIALATRLAEVAPGAVTALDPTGDDLRAALTVGGEARLGDASRLDAKVRALVTVLEQVDLHCLAVVDLRLPGSPVLTREEGCS